MRALVLALSLIAAMSTQSANAALAVGAPAPDFKADAALAGQPYSFHLAEALKKGPVVLYFYPKAFTQGCTVEAHLFAEASEKFAAAGVTVIGMSHDNIDTLKKFSTEECRNKFAVAADPDSAVIKSYDAKLAVVPGMADRISYLIGQDGKIVAVHAAMDPSGHVQAMFDAVATLKRR